jgi:hypothetical protein
MQFRVHKTILSANSPVFRDMFSIPQPSSGPTVDNCPLVNLHDDPEELYLVLKTIYDRKFVQ